MQKEAAANQAEQVLAEQAAVNAQQAAAVGAPGVYTAPGAVPYDAATAADMSFVNSNNALPASTYGATATPAQLEAARASTGAYDLAGKGITSLGTEAGRSAAIQGMGGGMGAAKYGMAAASPIIADAMTPEQYVPPEIKSDADMGQRYAFESGYDNSVPGRTGPASYRAISDEEAKKLYGFAEGGDIQYPTGESVVRMAKGGGTSLAGLGYGPGIDYSGYDTLPNQGIASVIRSAPRASSVAAPAKGYAYDPISRRYVGSGTDAEYLGGGAYGKSAADLQAELDAKAAEEAAAAAAAPAPDAYMYYAAQGGLMDSYAQGGISTLGSYSDGGRLLKGPGDGMSDNIPAKIGEKQPARLADGEFVVPADVVSHLGNGSTDAGAKQLYKMMDKVRTARTGRKAQGKQINPKKYMPA